MSFEQRDALNKDRQRQRAVSIHLKLKCFTQRTYANVCSDSANPHAKTLLHMSFVLKQSRHAE